jgi:hypothetical protein
MNTDRALDSAAAGDDHLDSCSASHCRDCHACGHDLELNIVMGYDAGAYLAVLCDPCADDQARREHDSRSRSRATSQSVDIATALGA